MKPFFVILTALVLGAACQGQQIVNATNCSTMNQTFGPFGYGTGNEQQHVTGSHQWANAMTGKCTYTGQAQLYVNQPCHPRSTSTSASTVGETGITTPYWHSGTAQDLSGVSDGVDGGTATSDAEGAASIVSCAILPCGAGTITITGGGAGGGFSVTFPPNPLWTAKNHYSNTCTGYTLNAEVSWMPAPCPTPNPPYPPGAVGFGQNWTWDPYGCEWVNLNGATPVIFDTKGEGFHFSDPTKGRYVTFDLVGDGTYFKLSWPKHGSGNAWLVLDDGTGIVKNGKQLFGNYTPHSNADWTTTPNNESPNGFLALAWYDQPEQGGDRNLIIDAKDAVWPKLRLWIDEHCYLNPDVPCQSDPSELHSLESEGVTSISLVYGSKPSWDKVGNEFKFFTVVNPEAETKQRDEHGSACCDLHQKSHDARLAYDVYLKVVN